MRLLRGNLVSRVVFIAAVAALIIPSTLLAACTPGQPIAAAPGTPSSPAPSQSSSPATTSVPMKALKVAPEQGLVGTNITVSGEGLPANQTVELSWSTVDGSYDMKPMAETIEYYDRKFTPKRVPFGTAKTDADGKFTTTLTIPEDYGETHDIIAAVGGQDVAKGGFTIFRNVTISSTEGTVGSNITLDVKGLGHTAYSNTLGVLYDNNYVGFISAVTTRGSAKAQIRASGPPGKHIIRVTNSSAAVPYMNTQQSPVKLNPEFRFDYTVTGDNGPAKATLEFPDPGRISTANPATRTTASTTPSVGAAQVSLSSSSGPILSKVTVNASGLPAGANIDLIWVSAKGNRLSPSGWNLTQNPLWKATTDKDGKLTTDITIPDDLGGWHSIRLVQGEKPLVETGYYIERSIVAVTPSTVKAGEQFTVQIKGVGWTELDNTVTVSYDNSYMGYACGFNSQGDVTLNLVAYGAPGTHLIDLYPTIFLGHGKGPWDYDIPQLSFAQDHPSLSLGYKPSAVHAAITVVP